MENFKESNLEDCWYTYAENYDSMVEDNLETIDDFLRDFRKLFSDSDETFTQASFYERQKLTDVISALIKVYDFVATKTQGRALTLYCDGNHNKDADCVYKYCRADKEKLLKKIKTTKDALVKTIIERHEGETALLEEINNFI